MARIYKTRCPATYLYLGSLDAWTARERIQKNTEAVYEEARDDGRVIFPAYREIASITTPAGPWPIRLRMDRNGLWRTQYIDILFAPGGLNAKPVWAVITDTYRRPTSDTLLGGPGGSDPYAEWSPATTSTPAWLGAQAVTFPRDWAPSIVERGDGVERGRMRLAWLSVWIFDAPVGNNPRLAGFRHYEHVEDEP